MEHARRHAHAASWSREAKPRSRPLVPQGMLGYPLPTLSGHKGESRGATRDVKERQATVKWVLGRRLGQFLAWRWSRRLLNLLGKPDTAK